jgi:putative copper export protein
LISGPAFGNTQAVQRLQALLDRRLLVLAWASLFVALVTGAAWLVMVASNMSGMPLTTVLRGGVLGIVLTQTRFGEDWLIRAALVVVIAGCLLVQGYTRKHVSVWIGLLASAAFMASLAWAGHGAATENVPFAGIHLPADILHLLATGAWLGALLPLVLLLAEVRHDGSPDELEVAQAATLRFSTLGLTSVGTLLVTGLVNTWFLSGTVAALLGTLYGQLLLVKVALFATMIAVASRNRTRFIPRLTAVASEASVRLRALRQLGGNASIEASIGVLVLAVVGIIGTLPPGLHTEPNWPLAFRLDLGEIATRTQTMLGVIVVFFALCLVATAFAVQRKRYREMAASIALLLVLGGIGWVALRPGIVRAYPTSFYASTQSFAAPSVARGMPLYAQNCIVCHGAAGHGDGPLANTLPTHPKNLTVPHLFAHKVGDIFWWVSHGSDDGVMPGFANKLTPDQRWDLINFVLARASGDLSDRLNSQITTTAGLPLPDFAFEQNNEQNTLSQMLKTGPVLVVLFGADPPRARLEQLARWGPRLGAKLQIVAVGLDPSPAKGPLIVEIADDVRATLSLFRSATDGGETELMLDRGANIRARWTASGAGGLAESATLLADAVRVASIPVAAANHAGHAH